MTITTAGELSRDTQFFTAGDAGVTRLVFCPARVAAGLAARLDGLPGVEVISTRRNVELAAMLANLTARGIGRLFAEGGTMIHTHLTSRSDLVQYLKSR